MNSICDEMKKSIPYGDHEMHFSCIVDPNTFRVCYGVRCVKCGWRFRTDEPIDVNTATTDRDDNTKKHLFNLMRSFVQAVDADCKTASLMAIVTSVHDR